MNMRQPPFDNRLVRLAINMAIDKATFAAFFGVDPLRTLTVSPVGYEPPKSLPVTIAGMSYDLLAYDPGGARELLAAAGHPDGRQLRFDLHVPDDEWGLEVGQIVAHQLERNLGIEAHVAPTEGSVLWSGTFADHFSGMGCFGGNFSYGDPCAYLKTLPSQYGAGWDGAAYFAALESANAILDPALRYKKFAESEAQLLREMPIIPLSTAPSIYMFKPYVKGWTHDMVGDVYFRYVWIDHNWNKGATR